jgi:hypothetical protein
MARSAVTVMMIARARRHCVPEESNHDGRSVSLSQDRASRPESQIGGHGHDACPGAGIACWRNSTVTIMITLVRGPARAELYLRLCSESGLGPLRLGPPAQALGSESNAECAFPLHLKFPILLPASARLLPASTNRRS